MLSCLLVFHRPEDVSGLLADAKARVRNPEIFPEPLRPQGAIRPERRPGLIDSLHEDIV